MIEDKVLGKKRQLLLYCKKFRNKGIVGWFRGFGAKMWQTMLTSYQFKRRIIRSIVKLLGATSCKLFR